MNRALILMMAAAGLFGQSLQNEPDSSGSDRATDLNVNSRYTVESISFANQQKYRLSPSALDEMRQLIGSKLNTEALNRLASQIRDELRAMDVTFRVARGGEPQSVKVLLEVEKGNSHFDLSIPKFAYNTSQGWTGMGEASLHIAGDALTFAVLSDGDSLAERFTGFQARFEHRLTESDRIRLGFEFDDYHEQYNRASVEAFDNATSETTSSLGAGAYRSRRNFEPSATFVLAKPLTLTVGASFETLEPQVTAARSESANAMINTLRYHQRWEESDSTKQELDAGYSLRAATRLLGTDLAYTRHLVNARYNYTHQHHLVEVTFLAGAIFGTAPLFERFVLGNNGTLRGWDKYQLDPLGGNRMINGSVTYGYHVVRVFYDTGAVWDQGKSPSGRQSAGVGVMTRSAPFWKWPMLVAVAFPIRQGHVEPVLIAGMNF